MMFVTFCISNSSSLPMYQTKQLSALKMHAVPRVSSEFVQFQLHLIGSSYTLLQLININGLPVSGICSWEGIWTTVILCSLCEAP